MRRILADGSAVKGQRFRPSPARREKAQVRHETSLTSRVADLAKGAQGKTGASIRTHANFAKREFA